MLICSIAGGKPGLKQPHAKTSGIWRRRQKFCITAFSVEKRRFWMENLALETGANLVK